MSSVTLRLDYCPPIDPKLVEWLKRNFPERAARTENDTLPHLMFEGGKAFIIRLLEEKLNQQEKIKYVPQDAKA